MGKLISLLFSCTIVCSSTVFAQALSNNNALITITPSTRVSIMGGVLNNGDLTNEGTMSVTGDWMNVDTYNPANGLFILNGTTSQSIAHNGQAIYQMIIEGGGEKDFTSDLEIQDTLALVDGKIIISDGVTLLVQASGTVVGGSDISYVDGPLFHQGTGYKYYPVGTNNNFRPAELTNVTGMDPIIGISVNEPNTNPIVPLQLLAVSDTRYWQLEHQSGVYDGSRIRVKVGPDEQLGSGIDLLDVVVSSLDSIGGIFQSLGQSQFSGSLLDGELVSSLPAISEFYAIAVEGFAEERSLFVPNVLSPAASDPEDQVVKVYGQQIIDDDFMFRIYNRWGQVVYETISFSEANNVGWNGEAVGGGDMESVGVYHYTLVGRFASGNAFSRKGSITIIR